MSLECDVFHAIDEQVEVKFEQSERLCTGALCCCVGNVNMYLMAADCPGLLCNFQSRHDTAWHTHQARV
jgi:hypothetical protein